MAASLKRPAGSAEDITVAHPSALRQDQDRPDLDAIAHDLSNLLTAISGYASLIVDSQGTTAELQRDAAEIVEAAARAVPLVRQLHRAV
jgi:signal transduction histidine kinase